MKPKAFYNYLNGSLTPLKYSRDTAFLHSSLPFYILLPRGVSSLNIKEITNFPKFGRLLSGHCITRISLPILFLEHIKY